MRVPILALALLVATALPAAALEAGSLQDMIDGLNALIDKGEKERPADPWYLKDLRDLPARYDTPGRDARDGRALTNKGGDFSLRRIMVMSGKSRSTRGTKLVGAQNFSTVLVEQLGIRKLSGK